MKIFVFIGLILIVTCCKVLRESENRGPGDTETETQNLTPEILTLVFEINSTDSVYLINAMQNPGILRENNNAEIIKKNGALSLIFLDDSRVECSTITIPNPLVKRVEFSDDYIHLRTKSIDLESASFSVRVQYEPCMKYISVTRIINILSNKYKELVEIPIKLNDNE